MKSLVPLFLMIPFVFVYNVYAETFAIESANVYHKVLQKCYSRGGLPAMIRNKRENEIAFEMIKHLTVAPFIGIEANLDEFGEIANWTYSDESGLSYENWESGSSEAVNSSRICTALSLTTGQWEAVHCYVPRPFLCSLQQKESRDRNHVHSVKKRVVNVVEDCETDEELQKIEEIEKRMQEIRDKSEEEGIKRQWLGKRGVERPPDSIKDLELLDDHHVWLSPNDQILRVLASIKRENLGQGSSVSDEGLRGLYQSFGSDCESYDLGHVIAEALGGHGVEENLVLQNSEFNQKHWRGTQSEIRKWLNHDNADQEGRYVIVAIFFTYSGDLTKRPEMFYYDFKFKSGKDLIKSTIGAYENVNQGGVIFQDCKVGHKTLHYPSQISSSFYKRRSCAAKPKPTEGYGEGLWPTVPGLKGQ